MEALFELQLRLGNQVVPIKVYGSDDRKTLTERVCRDHRIENHFRNLIQSKIVEALNKLAHSTKVSRNLQMKVQRFLNFDRSPRKLSEIQQKSLSSSQYSKRNSQSFNLNNESMGRSYDRYRPSTPVQPQPRPSFKEIENVQPPKSKSKLKSTNTKETQDSTFDKKMHNWHPSGKPTQFDRDLLAAYRNVLKKCKNPEMKNMVSSIVNQLENEQSGRKHPPLPKKIDVSQFTETKAKSMEKHNSLDKYMPAKQPVRSPDKQPKLFSFQSIELDKKQPVRRSPQAREFKQPPNISIQRISSKMAISSVLKERSQKTLQDYEQNLAKQCERYMKARQKALQAMQIYKQVRDNLPRRKSPPRHPTLQQLLYLRPVESLPTSQKNSFIKPSTVPCVRPQMRNGRRYRYLNDGEY